jgi:voltage-gated potassium channel Kch
MCGAIFRLPLMDSLKKAVLLAQAGEFGFVLLGLPAVAGALPAATLQILVAVISLSLVFSPLLFRAFIAVYSRHANKDLKAHDEIVNDHPAVIIAGIGRVGQIVARVLRLQKIHFSCLEHDHAQVQVARRFGIPTYLGDASRLDLLEAAGARHARVFVLAIQNLESSLAAARVVRAHFPHLKIVARVRNRAHAFELMDLGVEEFVRETFAGSLELADLVLRHHGVGEESRRRTESRFRFHDAKLLMDQYKIRKDPDKLIRYTNEFTQQLISVFEEDEKRDTSGQSTHSS